MLHIFEQHALKMGIEWIGHEVIPLFGAIDTSVEWLRLAGKKPDWIIGGFTGGTSTVTAIKDALRLEIAKSGIKFISPYPLDEALGVIAGEAATEGWYIFRRAPASTEAELPGMKDVYEAAKRYRGWEPETLCSTYVEGWVTAMVGVEGIRLAIENVGFENLTGRAVRDGLASIKDFDTGLIPAVTMDDGRPYYCKHLKIYQFEHNRMMPRTEWIEPFLMEELGYF